MADKAKVLVACCNRLLKESIARILSKKVDLEVIVAQMLPRLSREEFVDCPTDVLVLDSMELWAEMSAASSTVLGPDQLPRCVLVAMEDDRNRFLSAIRNGARGYVLQEASALEVVSAIRAVAEGQAVCPSRYTRILFDCVATQAGDVMEVSKRVPRGLTRREQQLIPLIGRRLSNKEIASRLNLSEQTVKNHIHRIMRKIDVTDRLSAFEACRDEEWSTAQEG